MEKETRHPTHRNRFLRAKTRRRPSPASGQSVFGSVRAVWAGGSVFSFRWTALLIIHVAHPNCQHPLSDFAAQKSSPYPIFLAASEVQQLLFLLSLFLFLSSCFLLLPFLHGSLPSLTKTKHLSQKKKLKG